MEWWSLFRTVRRVSFAIISVLTLIWAILLSVYIAREWKHAIKAQRIIILVMILADVFTSVLLYLMIVVVFQPVLELARVISLFGMHLALAVSLTVVGRNFDCSVFGSQSVCSAVYKFTLFITWTIAVFFVLHAIYLLVMSRIPRPNPDPMAKPIDPEEEFFPEKKDLPDSPGSFVSSSAEKLTLTTAPARLVRVDTITGQVHPHDDSVPPVPSYPRRESTLLEAMATMPALPYGAPPADFLRTASPAPSYTSQDANPGFVSFPPRRPRQKQLMLNRYALDPLLRKGSMDSTHSAASYDSFDRSSTYSYTADGGIRSASPLSRPPQAMVAERLSPAPSSACLPYDVVPPQLRPGTPVSLSRNSSYASNYSGSSEHVAITECTARSVPARGGTATPVSIHSIAPSLLFMDQAPRTPVSAGTHVRGSSDPGQQVAQAVLSRQPTKKLRLPNPFSPEGEILEEESSPYRSPSPPPLQREHSV